MSVSSTNNRISTINCAWNDYGTYLGSGYSRYVFTTTGTNACNITISGYNPLVYYYVVGGGSAGCYNISSTSGANGPGLGSIMTTNHPTPVSIPAGSYNITVGNGGTPNTDNTQNSQASIFSYNNITSAGGQFIYRNVPRVKGNGQIDILNNEYYYACRGGDSGKDDGSSAATGGAGVSGGGDANYGGNPNGGSKGTKLQTNGGSGGNGGNGGIGGGGGPGGGISFSTGGNKGGNGGNGGIGGGGGGGREGGTQAGSMTGSGGNGGFGYTANYRIIGGGAGGGSTTAQFAPIVAIPGSGSQGYVVIIVQDKLRILPIINVFPSFSKVFQDVFFNLNANSTNTETTITYTSANTFVATVDSYGNVTIGNVGNTQIQLYQPQTDNYLTVTTNTMVNVSRLQSTLNYTVPGNIKYNDLSFNLRANTNVNSATIRYTTSNPLIANVTSTGNVIVGNAGTANINLTILETNNYSTISANILISVNRLQANLNYPAISSITKNYKDALFALNANTTNTDNTTISYTTNNAIVANVNAFGNITIGNAGTANITLTRATTTNYNSVTANILISVNRLQANLNYPANTTLTKNYKDALFALNANTTNTDNTTISYSTDNDFVATVNTTGNVTIGNVGTANITLTRATTTNYNSVTANILITVNRLQANLNYPANTTLTKNYLDATFALNANTTNTDNTQIAYSTDNAFVATVNTTGNITIGNVGTANIVLTRDQTTNYNSVTANIVITVNPIQANLNYPTNSTLTKNYKDATFPLNANTTNKDSSQLLYSTDNSSVAIVDTVGNVVVGNAGTANIQISGIATLNYKSTISNILITVTPIKANLNYPANTNLNKNYLDAPFNLNANTTNTDNTEIVYSTDNTIVADINVTGDVTIGNAGTANITLIGSATNNYLSTIANIVINVAKLTSTITVPSSFTTVYGNTDIFNLGATNTNPETDIVYTVINPNIATIFDQTGNVVAGNVGNTRIQLFQPETTNYLTVTANTYIQVDRATPEFIIDASFTSNYQDIPFSILPNIVSTNTDPLPAITYNSNNPTIANVVNGIVTIGNAGNAQVTLIQSQTENFISVTANTVIYVNKIQPTILVDSTFNKNYGDLSFNLNAFTTNTDSSEINYTSDNLIVAEVDALYGNVTVKNVGTANIVLTQPETDNFLTVSTTTTVNVVSINPTITVEYPITKTYGDIGFNINAYSDNTETPIIYESLTTSVANIDSTGNISILNAGNTIITLTQGKTANFDPISANTILYVNKQQANIQVDPSFTRIYGNVVPFNLGATNTNPETPIEYTSIDTFVATVDSFGNVIAGNAGTTRIQLFQPETSNYLTVTANTNINVNRQQSVLTFPSSFTKVYNDASFSILSDIDTNNTDPYENRIVTYRSDNQIVANIVDGTMILGNAGIATIVLTQPQTTNFTDISAVTSITVNRFTSSLTFPTSFTQVYRDASFSILSNIATNNTDPYANRVITYLSDNSVVADIIDGTMIIGNAGTARVTLTQPQTTNFTDISAVTTITVNKFTASLTFPPSFTKVYNDASFSILSNIATNNSDPYASRIVTYQSDNQIVANIVAGTMIIGNAGTANIVLTQPETTNYTDASAVTTIDVNRFNASLTFPSTFTKRYKDASFSILSNIGTNNTDPYASRVITYQSDNSITADIVDGTMIIGNAGTANIVLSQPQTTNYTDVSAVTSITVNRFPASLEFPSTFTRVYNDPSFSILSNIMTNNTDPYANRVVSYLSDNQIVANIVDGTVTIGNAGTATIVLTQPQTTNFTDISAVTTITVNRFTTNLTFPPNFTKVYNDPSFSILSDILTNNTDPYASRIVTYQTDNSIVANIVAGTMIIGNAGTANVTLTQPETTNFTDISAVTTITVNRFPASLTFPPSFTKVYKDASFSILSNIATNNTDPYASRIVTYQSDNSVTANIVDGTVTIGNAGIANVILTQPQTTNFTDVSAVTSITVNKFPASLTFPPSFTNTYRDASFSILSNIVTNNTDPYANRVVTYSSDNTAVANIIDGTMIIGNAGTANIVLTQPETINYTDITAVTTITVNRFNANLVFPSSFMRTYRDASFSILSNIATNNSDPYASRIVTYLSDNSIVANIVDGTVIIGNAGIANVILTQPQTTNYTDISAVTTINVNRFASNLTFPATFTQTYKDASFSILSNIATNNTDPYASRIVTYRSDNQVVANIVAGTMIIGNAGIANIVLTQPQTTNFTDISAVTSITVNRFPTNLTFPSTFTRVYKDASFSILSNIGTNNTDPYATRIVTYQSDNSVTANIVDGTVTIGNAGTANVVLTQPQTTNYTDISAVTSITVNRFTSNLTFPAIFTQTYKDASFSILSNIGTNNTDPYETRIVTYQSDNTSVANIIDGNMIIGNAGTALIVLTQPQTTNYTDISAVTAITVNRFPADLTFPATFTRVYRDASFSILSNIGTNNTDPYNSRIVTYQSDNPAVANIVNGNVIIGNAGTARIVLTQPQTTNYTDISAVTTITVNRFPSDLTFPATFTRVYRDASFSILSNIATNNTDPYASRIVTYQSDNSAVANIIDGKMIIGNAGTARVTLTQPQTTNYTDISAVTTITVNRFPAVLTFPPSFAQTYRDASFSILSNIGTNNTDPYNTRIVTYQSDNSVVANIVDGTMIIGNAGTSRVTLTQPQTTNYTDISAVTTITVNKFTAGLTFPSSFTRTYRDASFSILSNIVTNNTDPYTVSYQSNNPIVANIVAGTVTIGNAGSASVVLTQPETANYTDVSAVTTITVNKLSASLTFPPSFTQVYRDASFSILSNIGTNNTDPYATRVVSYQSNNAVVANIVAGNMIIGNAGTATITLTQPQTTNYTDISAVTTITVNRLTASLTVDPSFTRFYQSGSFNIIPNISTSNTDSNRVLQYTTSDATIASVVNGIVTIGNSGNAVITIRQLQTPNYLEVTATTVVYVRPIQANITVSPTFTTTYRNAAFPINATTNNSETPIVYSSSNPIVANVVNGIVTIGNVGNTIVTMTQGNTANYLYTSATSIIYVNRKQPTITVDSVYNKLLRDVSFQLIATTDNRETPIQYTPLDTNIVTVVPGGNVTIGNVGNTVMTLYQPETTNYLSVSANTQINIINNAFQKVGNLIQLQQLVNSGGKQFYVKNSENNYINIEVSVINK